MRYKTQAEFGYDLYRDDDGKHFVRIKQTGEKVEVSLDIFRVMRNSAQSIYRQEHDIPVYALENDKYKKVGSASKSAVNFCSELPEMNRVISDGGDGSQMMYYQIYIEDFKESLTSKQKDVFDNCMVQGVSQRDYAQRMNITEQSLHSHKKAIQKKYSEYFF